MKNKIILLFVVVFFIFVFVIFYKGLNKINIYTPVTKKKDIPEFTAKSFYGKEKFNSKNIFDQNKIYLLNIWASWCLPCRDEHSLLIRLSKNDKIEIIGLNYKDNFYNAEKFINELGNPYSKIFSDRDGTLAVDWGAFGVPETFLIFKNKIVKKYVGPLNIKVIEEIEDFVK